MHFTELEDEYDMDVVFAADFGSHAFGLEGPNSDLDVLFVFSQDPSVYITDFEYRDTIDRSMGNIDYQGWNIRKFANLLESSNPTAIDMLRSPVVYRFNSDIMGLRSHAIDNFNPIALYYHYRSQCEQNYEKYIVKEKDPTNKRNIFCMRGLLNAMHIRKDRELPPMNFREYAKSVPLLDAEPELSRYIEDKKNGKVYDVGNPFKESIEAELAVEIGDEYNEGNIPREPIQEMVNSVVFN